MRAHSLEAAESLRFTLGLQDRIAVLDDQAAIRLDRGVHAKHRLMGYHDFFVKRIKATDVVLDIGCGNGAVTHDIAVRSGAAVLALDLLPENIALAKRDFSHPNVRYEVADATATLPAANITVAVLSNVLEHLADRPGLLRRISRLTGCRRFLIRVPLFEREWRVPLRRELGMEWRSDPTHDTEYTVESFDEEMRESGLETVHRETRWGEIWAECIKQVAVSMGSASPETICETREGDL
jgi:SAM-dependent methyltransferase